MTAFNNNINNGKIFSTKLPKRYNIDDIYEIIFAHHTRFQSSFVHVFPFRTQCNISHLDRKSCVFSLGVLMKRTPALGRFKTLAEYFSLIFYLQSILFIKTVRNWLSKISYFIERNIEIIYPCGRIGRSCKTKTFHHFAGGKRI